MMMMVLPRRHRQHQHQHQQRPPSCSPLLRRPTMMFTLFMVALVAALLSTSSSSTSFVGVADASTFRDMTARSYLCDNNMKEIEKPLPISSWDPTKSVRVCIRRNPNIHMDIFIHEISTYTFQKEEYVDDSSPSSLYTNDSSDKYTIQQVVIKDGEAVAASTKVDCKTGASLCSFETTLKDDFFSSDGTIKGMGTVALRYGKFQNNNSNGGDGGSRNRRSLRAGREQGHGNKHEQERRELQSFAGFIDVELEIETTTDPVGNAVSSVYGTVTGTNGEWVTVPLLRTVLIILLIVLALCFCCCAIASFCRGRRDKLQRRKEIEDMMIDRASRHSSTHSKHVRIAKSVTKTSAHNNARRVSSSTSSSASADDSEATFADDDLSSRMCLTPSQHSRKTRASMDSSLHKSPRRLSKSPHRVTSKSPRRLNDSPRRLREQRQGNQTARPKTSLDSSSLHSRKSTSSAGKKPRQLRRASMGSSAHTARSKASLDSSSLHSRKSASSPGKKPRQLRRASMGSSAHTNGSSSSFGKKLSDQPKNMHPAKYPSPQKKKKGPKRNADSTLLSQMV